MVILCNTPYPEQSDYENYFGQFPYELSDFQKYAIQAIVEGNHVLTTAHTGSGKTLSAEFAIQYFTEQNKKVIYTSPIKALSNQKYYDFTKKYPHITFGLLTGDIKLNPTAQVLIMTTEILMNYLFVMPQNQGDSNQNKEKQPIPLFEIDIATELGCVVFDEVHYINDEHRGQVWEQTILMLPKHIQMVMLSATIDAPEKFAKWIEDRYPEDTAKVVLASTNMRVVPLTHYAYIASTEGLFKSTKNKELEMQWRASTNKIIKIQTEHGHFINDNWKQVRGMLDVMETKDLRMKRKFVLNNLATYMKENEMLPAIAFVFSRKQVEACAAEITSVLLEDDSKVPYVLKRECDAILRGLPNWQEYANLPEYQTLIGWMEKGIAIHHSGMIPVLREMVELMISKGYIKLLFATESFAIGLDCPIRTAIFTGLTKYDGNTHRFLHPHEYTQMAGRAGRRGIDTIGYVVHCNNLFPCPSMTEYKQILCGRPQTLISKFHVNYNMVLSLLKHGNADFVSFTRKSMLQNETAKLIDGLERQMADACKEWKTKEGHILTTLRTPIDVCVKYNEYTQQWSGTINKKRKELERQLKQLEEAHKYIKSDARFVLDVTALETQYNKTRTEYHAAVEYVECQVKSVVHILEKGRFIVEEDTTSIPKLTLLGKQASQLAEGHPLVIVECLRDTDAFSEYSVYQIIGWLSCFVDIKVDEETRLQEPKCDTALCHLIQKTKSRIEYYAVTEREYGIHTGTNVGLQYDFIEIVCNWASGCNDEMECKLFLQSISELVSVGDFTKMCLKICNMVYELSNVCEMFGYTECLFKLSQIPKVLLKYIATTQSLYTGGGATRP